MEIKKELKGFTDKTRIKISIVITLLSSILLISTLVGSAYDYENFNILCLFNIVIEFAYGVTVSYLVLKSRAKYKHLLPFLFSNWFIGCFSTNIFINIFENLPIWVYVVTFLFCLSSFGIYNQIKIQIINRISYFINGFSYLLILYYAIYLIPYAPISLVGIMALGLGFYGLAPMIVLLSHTALLTEKLNNNKEKILLFGSGVVLVLIGFSVLAIGLNMASKQINSYSTSQNFENQNSELPLYIIISQHISPNIFNEILLKKELVYISTNDFFGFRGFDSFGNNQQYNERKTHDPIINLAYLFTENLNLTSDDRINILKSNFDKRLEAEEQLWSGRDLFTKNIKEDVKIYADNRLAYTEITMDIECEKRSWGNKEAIYSFQLPEGAVATSLSLWVNGIERKGVLTTKEKAKNAYKKIVSVEARDPSLMQWKEGNKIVVRVFPISYDLPRTFKCGFTTPLKWNKNSLSYQSLNIKGPNINDAKTISRIQLIGNQAIKNDKIFELENGYYINHSTGLKDWNATIPANEKVYNTAFIWKNKAYEIHKIKTNKIFFEPTEIVLDLNNSWTEEEAIRVINQTNKKCYAWLNNQKTEINNSNIEALFSVFEDLSYSLLPLYELEKNSLIITKCGTISANFEELQNSIYLQKLKAKTQNKNIRVINFSENINPYWQTVKEQQLVKYLKTDWENTITLLHNNQFIETEKLENSIVVEPANIAIQETNLITKTKNNGTNHIFRMYAFGKVVEEQVAIQKDSLVQNKFVDLAKEANIVTPISSLIVLETDEDYKNNGIEKKIDTLGNASINNDGAVPEPYEWLLIIIGLSLIAVFYKNKIAVN